MVGSLRGIVQAPAIITPGLSPNLKGIRSKLHKAWIARKQGPILRSFLSKSIFGQKVVKTGCRPIAIWATGLERFVARFRPRPQGTTGGAQAAPLSVPAIGKEFARVSGLFSWALSPKRYRENWPAFWGDSDCARALLLKPVVGCSPFLVCGRTNSHEISAYWFVQNTRENWLETAGELASHGPGSQGNHLGPGYGPAQSRPHLARTCSMWLPWFSEGPACDF